MLMAWSESRQLVERFRSVTAFLGQQCKHWRLGNSYSGWLKALKKQQGLLVPLIVGQLRRHMQALPARTAGRWQTFGVDGTLLSCPRTQENQAAMGEKGQKGGRPLVSLTAIIHLQLNLPWAFRVGPGSDAERMHLRSMVDELPAESLLVGDAGFIGYELGCELASRKQHFLMRVAGNKQLFSSLGYTEEVAGKTVYLWPASVQDKWRPPLQLRLIVLKSSKEPIYLVTSVLDEAELTDAEAAEIYASRWGVEVKFRTLKQTMQHTTLCSRTPEHCYLELTWIYIGVWLLELMAIGKLLEDQRNPREVSPAQTRNLVRRVLRYQQPCCDRRTFSTLLAACRVDSYPRKHPKASRNYPRKRAHRPPSPPKIKPPEPKQIQRAQQLTPIQIRR